MSRFETNRHRLEYEYGFDASWETLRDAFAPPRRSLSGGLVYDAPRPRHGPRDKSSRLKDRDRERERDRDRRSYVLVDGEREDLKRRLSRANPAASSALSPRRHNRARSLSLSRASSSESSVSLDSEQLRNIARHRPLVKHEYYQHDRMSLSSPKVQLAAWPPSRPGSRRQSPDPDSELELEREREWRQSGRRDRYERGFQLIEQRHSHSADPRLSVSPVHAADLRFGMQRMSLGPEARALSSRSASFDAKNNGSLARRKGVSLSPGRAERMAPLQKHRPLHPQYNQVHVLILTWFFHDLRAAPYTAPPTADYVSLEDETRRLRDTLESYGYQVHEFLIPMQRSMENMRNKLKQFCRLAADDTLLIVYYHGHGSLDDENELVFSSHEHPANPEWAQAAAAEMYSAMMSGDACPSHGRQDKFQQLVKKYERYRPVAEVKWDDVRQIVLGAPCDLLLILDCCAAGGANLRHVNWQPPPSAEGFTKHLFAACGFESSTSDDMTAAMCDVLDEWVPGQGLHRDPSMSAPGPGGPGVGAGPGSGMGGALLSSPSAVSPFLTTKRLHQIMEDRLQKDSAGSQPIFKQLLPHDPEQYITLPNLLDRGVVDRRGRRRGYFVA